ncbi:hypothetical protein [Sphingomonas sp. BE137]|uniref:hypothetical protein n=1 Tax=Sphingomonas sp. BE137 TaxID=2817844 RepID=UPI001AE959A5|nr:hypothetical protein [Sphingomonas sp. BE137]MDR6850361.1 hypothetical protein [Sphingomonas sp. BE137]
MGINPSKFLEFAGFRRRKGAAKGATKSTASSAPGQPAPAMSWQAEKAAQGRPLARGPAPGGAQPRATIDDDDPAEMSGDSDIALARNRERARCAAIVTHPAAAGNLSLAISLATTTTASRAEAIGILERGTGRRGQQRGASWSGAFDRTGDRGAD